MSVVGATKPDGVMDAAIDTVLQQMREMDSISTRYRAELSASLANISAVEVAEVAAPTRPTIPETPVPVVSLDGMPVYSPISLVLPNSPEAVDISSLIADLDLDGIDIPEAPVMPEITLPDSPNVQLVDAPTRPDIDTTIELPAAPILDIPELGELTKITLPAFEFPQLPDFNGVPPDVSGITVPNVFINWSEPEYKSEILPELTAIIRAGFQGGTGLPAAIQDALFNRTRERDSKETERAVQEATTQWASRNFSMPPGMLVKQVDAIREQGRLKAAETNRDILIEAAKLEIENLRFMLEQGMALEQLTSNLYNNMAQRLFEVAKFSAESQISVFNAQIGLFNAQNAAFETLAQVYRTKLDGAISKLTAYKTAVDGQVAIGQINEQTVNVFKAKLEDVASNVEIYKTMMQGVGIRADAMKNQFDAYRADVQAYSERINAEKSKIDVYDARIRGETAKAGLYETQARAYASTIQAVSSNAEIQVKEAQLKMDAARTKITKYTADVDAYKAVIQANMNELQFNTQSFSAQVEAWRAQSSMVVANAEMQARFADMNTRTNIAYAEMQMSEYSAKMQNAIQHAQIALEAAKSVGQYTAQLAAGALSAAHVSASISGSGSTSTSQSYSESKSESTSHNYSY